MRSSSGTGTTGGTAGATTLVVLRRDPALRRRTGRIAILLDSLGARIEDAHWRAQLLAVTPPLTLCLAPEQAGVSRLTEYLAGVARPEVKLERIGEQLDGIVDDLAGRRLGIPVGDALIGRVIDPLGSSLDDQQDPVTTSWQHSRYRTRTATGRAAIRPSPSAWRRTSVKATSATSTRLP